MRFNSQIGVAASVAAGVAAMSIAANACAQTAVEWRVQDGGNGHWYEAVVGSSCVSWSQSRDSAAQSGGYLVTVTSTSESAFVRSHFAGFCFIGLFQDRTSPLYSEPDGGWRWVSGEPFGFANWNTQPGEASPNNANGDEDFAHLNLDAEGTWNDVRDNWCAPARRAIHVRAMSTTLAL